MRDARRLEPDQLCEALRAARERTLSWALDLSDEQWVVPRDPNIQPTAWDLAHIGWFAEFWVLRGPHRLGPDGVTAARRPGRCFADDAWLDSAVVAHAERWRRPPPREELLAQLAAQLDAVTAVLQGAADADTLYFAHLALLHECMHSEALAWTRATCGYPAPQGVVMPDVPVAQQLVIPGGDHAIGVDGSDEFAFDNEQPRHAVALEPFSIDSDPVRNDRYLEFVEDGGYQREDLWPDGRPDRDLPARWRRASDGSIEHRHFDRWTPLPKAQPVVHVNAREAEAFCRWAGRRLPRAAEWEAAAARGIRWGRTVWEWTADPFAPYTQGFRPGPYATYSAPWFHHQRELRGGSYCTDALVHDARYRNFFLPLRTDVFAGFRTAATT